MLHQHADVDVVLDQQDPGQWPNPQVGLGESQHAAGSFVPGMRQAAATQRHYPVHARDPGRNQPMLKRCRMEVVTAPGPPSCRKALAAGP